MTRNNSNFGAAARVVENGKVTEYASFALACHSVRRVVLRRRVFAAFKEIALNTVYAVLAS